MNNDTVELSLKEKHDHLLAAIPDNGSAFCRSHLIQDKVAQVGFEWPDMAGPQLKLIEEVQEFQEACAQQDKLAAQDELGDVLFVCVNLARHMQVKAEDLLARANAKFERRFNGVEDKVRQTGKSWQDFSLPELEVFWQEVKRGEK